MSPFEREFKISKFIEEDWKVKMPVFGKIFCSAAGEHYHIKE